MFNVTIQRMSDYATKHKTVQTQAQADKLVSSAIASAKRVKYDDSHNGMDYGLIRSLRLCGKDSDYVMTVHEA